MPKFCLLYCMIDLIYHLELPTIYLKSLGQINTHFWHHKLLQITVIVFMDRQGNIFLNISLSIQLKINNFKFYNEKSNYAGQPISQ